MRICRCLVRVPTLLYLQPISFSIPIVQVASIFTVHKESQKNGEIVTIGCLNDAVGSVPT